MNSNNNSAPAELKAAPAFHDTRPQPQQQPQQQFQQPQQQFQQPYQQPNPPSFRTNHQALVFRPPMTRDRPAVRFAPTKFDRHNNGRKNNVRKNNLYDKVQQLEQTIQRLQQQIEQKSVQPVQQAPQAPQVQQAQQSPQVQQAPQVQQVQQVRPVQQVRQVQQVRHHFSQPLRSQSPQLFFRRNMNDDDQERSIEIKLNMDDDTNVYPRHSAHNGYSNTINDNLAYLVEMACDQLLVDPKYFLRDFVLNFDYSRFSNYVTYCYTIQGKRSPSEVFNSMLSVINSIRKRPEWKREVENCINKMR